MVNDKLPEEIQEQIIFEAQYTINEGESPYRSYEQGATAWAPWKVKYDELQALNADMNLALAAMLNGYQNLSACQKDWFTVPIDLINEYTKMVLECRDEKEVENG